MKVMKVISGAACVLFASLAWAQMMSSPNEKSGGIAIDNSTENYPDGAKWPTPQYEKPKASLTLREMVAGRTMKAAGLESELPSGISLGAGSAVRFTQDVPGARLTGRKLQDNNQTTDTPTPQVSAKQTTVKWFVEYPVQYQGVPLSKFSDVAAITDGGGQVQYLRKRNLPRAVDATSPTVDRAAAVAVGEAHAKTGPGQGALKTSTPSLEMYVDPSLRGHLAWTFTVTSDSLTSPQVRQYWVSAVGAPTILFWESQVYSTHFGTVSGNVWQTSSLGPVANNPLQDFTVNRTGGGGGSVSTGPDGHYGFTFGSGPATISGTLTGKFSIINDLAGPVMTRSASGTPAAAIDLNFGASTEFETAEVSAFYWENFIHEFASSVLLPGELANLPTNVNINSTCNAFWNGSTINFFRAGGGCPNMAYSDVVLHETGHGIDSMKGGIVDGGYSEGFGDSMAVLGTRQPCVGRDFFGAGTCLRPATNVDMWPPTSFEVHEVGKRYAQFVWELVQELRKTESDDDSFQIATKLVLGAAALNPSSIPDAVRLSFIVDDDDGDLTNGTPHCKELAAAADSRTIPHPACPVERFAYAWANNKNAASYTPSVPYSYNSAGGPITITRSGEGSYAVKFAGLGGSGTFGGNVQLTPYGDGHEHCRIKNWSSAGPDFVVNVRCSNSAHIPDDTQFTILVNWR